MCVIKHTHKMVQKAADHKPNNPSTDPRKAAAKLSPGKPPPSASWSRLKDPRVVPVSRALGGKDRHSKVCTVRGLRDRRVRLSVPTAIQLYDLQERLGQTQPSKAVDWLLNAARPEINELPPLQIPPAISITGPANPNATSLPQTLDFHEFRPDKRGLKVGGDDWAGRNDQGGTSRVRDSENETTDNTCGSIFRPGPSSLMLSHTPRVCHLTSQREDNWHNFGLSPLHVPAFSTSIPLGSHQHHNRAAVYHHPAGGIMNTTCDFLELQAVGSASQPSARSFHFHNTTGNLLHLQGETDGSG